MTATYLIHSETKLHKKLKNDFQVTQEEHPGSQSQTTQGQDA
jgi:hypothetical protein